MGRGKLLGVASHLRFLPGQQTSKFVLVPVNCALIAQNNDGYILTWNSDEQRPD
jgi:hypothetical protein